MHGPSADSGVTHGGAYVEGDALVPQKLLDVLPE